MWTRASDVENYSRVLYCRSPNFRTFSMSRPHYSSHPCIKSDSNNDLSNTPHIAINFDEIKLRATIFSQPRKCICNPYLYIFIMIRARLITKEILPARNFMEFLFCIFYKWRNFDFSSRHQSAEKSFGDTSSFFRRISLFKERGWNP